MGILDELSSTTGNKASNGELATRCLKMPALLHSVAEGLRTGTPEAKVDCAAILVEVAGRRADLLADFVTDFLDASKSDSKAVARLGFVGLLHVSGARPAEVYAARDYLLEVARRADALGLAAVAVLAALSGNNPNYRGKLIGALVRLLAAVPDKELPKWALALAPAVAGSPDAVKRLTVELAPRRAALPDAAAKKIDKLLVAAERSTIKQ